MDEKHKSALRRIYSNLSHGALIDHMIDAVEKIDALKVQVADAEESMMDIIRNLRLKLADAEEKVETGRLQVRVMQQRLSRWEAEEPTENKAGTDGQPMGLTSAAALIISDAATAGTTPAPLARRIAMSEIPTKDRRKAIIYRVNTGTSVVQASAIRNVDELAYGMGFLAHHRLYKMSKGGGVTTIDAAKVAKAFLQAAEEFARNVVDPLQGKKKPNAISALGEGKVKNPFEFV